METMDIRRLGLILAAQAEIDGMKIQNVYAMQKAGDTVYDQAAFNEKAEELRNLSHCHDDQL